jgi:hypothetical protein
MLDARVDDASLLTIIECRRCKRMRYSDQCSLCFASLDFVYFSFRHMRIYSGMFEVQFCHRSNCGGACLHSAQAQAE